MNEEFDPSLEPSRKPRDSRAAETLGTEAEIRGKVNSLGAELVALAKQRRPEQLLGAVVDRLQPFLVHVARGYLSREGLLYPEFLLSGFAVEGAILEALTQESLTKPVPDFFDLFTAQVEYAVERFRLRENYIDRYVLKYRGFTVRQQAAAAALVEASLQMPVDERRVVYAKVADGLDALQIAAKLEISGKDVRSILQKVSEAGEANIQKWIRRLEADDKRPRGGPQ